MDGGFVAVHRPTGRQGQAGNRRGLRLAELRTGLVTGRWVEFMRRIDAQAGGFFGPDRPEHGIGQHVDDPMDWWTDRQYPVDDHPVGVGRV